MQVVVLRLTGELTEFDECCIAAHWMSSRVVIPFIDLPAAKRDAQAALLQQAVEYTGCTWPVIEDLAALEAVRAACACACACCACACI